MSNKSSQTFDPQEACGPLPRRIGQPGSHIMPGKHRPAVFVAHGEDGEHETTKPTKNTKESKTIRRSSVSEVTAWSRAA